MLLFCVIILGAALVQGMTGFGFCLVAMPFLSLLLPLKVIVPVLVLCSLVLNMVIFFRMKGHLHLKRIAVMLVVGIVSTPLGVILLTVVKEKILKGTVAVLVILTALIMLKGIQVYSKNKYFTYTLTGFLSGLLNGSVSLSGPPVVLMLVNEGENKNDFKKNISGYFLALNIFSMPSFFMKGLISPIVLNYSIVGIAVLIVGALTGIKIGEGIGDERFKTIILLMIMAMGLMMLISIF